MATIFRRQIVAVIVGLVTFTQPTFGAGPSQKQLVGVNLAGAEFNSKKQPGKLGYDYIYPSEKDFDYFIKHGFNTFRVPFLWQRLQPKLDGDFEPRELREIDRVVQSATAHGASVILDPHNYGYYRKHAIGTKEVPTRAFAAFWAKLADRYKSNQKVIFGLMNEPYRIRADDWRRVVDAAIAAIRGTGARNLILVPGTIWSGVHSWQNPHKGVSNAVAFRDLSDPADNFAFELHQYFDDNYSGTKEKCEKGPKVIAAMVRMTKWLRENGHRGFLGEFGVADRPKCLEALDGVLGEMRAHRDIWIGWTYWAAGAWWGNYGFSVHPTKDGRLQPQMKVLKKYVPAR